MGFGTMLWWLIVAHCLVDFPLQGDTMAVQKNRNTDNALAKAVPWYYWLAAHALMHGGAVAALTGKVELGLLETTAHFGIDFAKCEKKISMHTDQLLHIACKLAWTAVVLGYGSVAATIVVTSAGSAVFASYTGAK